MAFLGTILFYAISIFQFILLARVLLSWFPNVDHSNPLIRLVYSITEPVLAPVRNMLPRTGFIDLSPLIVFLVISVLLQFIR